MADLIGYVNKGMSVKMDFEGLEQTVKQASQQIKTLKYIRLRKFAISTFHWDSTVCSHSIIELETQEGVWMPVWL